MKRAAFGFFAFWPVCMLALMLSVLFTTSFEPYEWFMQAWVAATAVFVVGWLWFIWDVWHNARVPAEKRALWTVVLVFAGPYALPFYFWFYVR